MRVRRAKSGSQNPHGLRPLILAQRTATGPKQSADRHCRAERTKGPTAQPGLLSVGRETK